MAAFVVIAGVLVLGSLGLVLAPMLRGAGRGEPRASYDMQVYRDQLREIEADRRRGVLGAEEAEATRVEVARRLIAAADAEGAEAGAATAPRRLSRPVGAALAVAIALAAGGLYARLGVPGFPDQPLALRLAGGGIEHAMRPGQAEVEAVVATQMAQAVPASPENAELVNRLAAILEERPDDLEGHRLLAQSLAALERFAEARAAQARVVELMGAGAGARDLSDLAELMIFAAQGYVSPEAEATLVTALARDPDEPRARYYSGLAALQAGRPDLAYPLWSRLLDESPPDAPWVPSIEAGIDEIARMAGLPPRETPAPAVARDPMVEAMVARLAARLADEGGPPEDWAQLVRSLGVLGRHDDARSVRDEARARFAADPAALAQIDAAAGSVGLAP
jgi:cytochrome c-type biogenesis protein CcmH